MAKFLDKVASYIKESDILIKDWVIILPSERAVQYLRSSLFKAFQQPILAPKLITINRWITESISESVLEKSTLLLYLFEIHRQHAKSDEDFSFDEFMSWGNILLNDFDEIDKNLVNSKLLFRNLKDIKEIENWSFDSEKLSKSQERFLEFWDRLPFYYNEFNELLRSKNALYTGKAYRKIAENIDLIFQPNKNAHFLFAGFNALTKSELTIFRQLIRMGRGHFLIDADAFYLKDLNHEAGQFIRKNLDFLQIKEASFVSNELENSSKKIEIISCSQNTGQAKVVGTILEQMSDEKIQNSLVLLADEKLIVPLLKNIPKKVQKANITLGLPLKNSSLRSWVELIFRIQDGFLKYKRVTAYYKDLMSFWTHPFVVSILNEIEKSEVYVLEKEMRKWNTIFQNPTKINVSKKLKKLINILYTPWENDWIFAIEKIRELNLYIYEKLEESNSYERAIIQGFEISNVAFQNSIKDGLPEMKIKTFRTFFNQQWFSESIAYYGNPIDGLQIMGLLETRLLDFETIIVLGMNEGNLPPTNIIQTIIPMDLRKYFEMSVTRDKQGVFAHHFYRLLQKCSEMYITYSSSLEGMFANEPSRYLLQLELELAKSNPNIKLEKKFYTIGNNQVKSEVKSIEKTLEIQKRLDEILENGISASAIKTFLNCPLDFYYKYVLKFGEDKNVEEEIESNTFGTFIHEVLEKLYQPFVRKSNQNPISLKVEDIDKMLKDVEYLMRQSFATHFKGNPEVFEKGKNYLSFSMALELAERFLKFEKERIQNFKEKSIYIEALEEELIYEISIEVFGVMKKVKLKGFIDRVDSWNGAVKITDYKSGKVKKQDVGEIKKPFSADKIETFTTLSKDSKHFFQLMMYSYLYYQKHKVVVSESSIISFVNLNNSPFSIYLKDYKMIDLIETFPEVLKCLLEELYDSDFSFEHTKSYFNFCQYC
jgi:ATP-dependent helicase/nuclease subunit B